MPASTSAHFSHFDLSHWLKVKAARHQLNRDKAVNATSLQPGHDLVDRIVLDPETGKHARVLEVHRQWLDGWYLMAILVAAGNGPRMARVVRNLSSEHPHVQRLAELFEQAPSFR